MADSTSPYTEEYFQTYIRKSRLTRRVDGDRLVYRYWIRFLRKHLRDGDRLLEIGCGLGFFGRLAQEHFDYIGTDISAAALQWAREHQRIRETSLVDAGTALPYEDRSFNAVVAFDVVEHLQEPAAFFSETNRILRSGGLLLLSTPNTTSLGVRLKEGSENLVASMYRDDTHVSLLPPDTWTRLIREAGLEITRLGTDHLWDVPYVQWCPMRLQQLLLMPLNLFVQRFNGMLRWSSGENLIVVARRP